MKNDGGDYEAHSAFIHAAQRRGRVFVPMRFPMQTLDAKGVSTVESVLKKVGLL